MSSDDPMSNQSGSDGSTQVEYEGEFAIIRMNRGENRMNMRFLDEMNDALDQILKNSSITTVITTGAGKFYCNGIDLTWVAGLVQSNNSTVIELFIKKWLELQIRILHLPLITVAAIDGHAMAGGAIFSLCHDYRVMVDSRGWWSVNEVHINLRFEPILVALLRARLSPLVLREAVVFGKRFTSQQAVQLNIVDLSVTPSQLITSAQQIALDTLPKGAQPIIRASLGNMKDDLYRDLKEILNKRTTDPTAAMIKYSKL